MAKIIIGDIFRINTNKGNVHFQYVFDGGDNGQLTRILPGLYSELTDVFSLVNSKELYLVVFPLQATFY